MLHETVFIVDDDASVRDALSLLLSLRGLASATFACAEDFLAAWRPHWRGCLVLDVRMPGMSGLDLQRTMTERRMALPVVIITAHGDVGAARQAFLARAVDFIEKPFDGEMLIAAIDRALASLPPTPAGADTSTASPDPADALTPREREVLELLVNGLHNRHVGERLGISPRTVEVHKARIMAKLNARTVIDLVRLVDQGNRIQP